MKFLCPQCKAKYRIADEKLAQRAASKMKCRKCGHVIDLQSAAVPESIRGDGLDDEDDSPAPAPAAPAARRPAAVAAPPPKRAVAAPARTAAAPQRRAGAVAVAQVPEPADLDEPARKPAPAPPRKVDFEEEEAPTRIHDGAALTAAFSKALGGTQRESQVPQSVPDEWYIGVNDAPLGPLSMSALREQASSGNATLDSLVWRDGFEEWKPLRDFPELAALVKEAKRTPAPVVVLAPTPAPGPAASETRPAAPIVAEPPGDLLEQIGAKPRRHGPHPAAWAAVIVALAFGVTIGVVLFSKTERQEVVKYIEVPASAKAQEPPEPGASAAAVIEDTTVALGPGPKRPVVAGSRPAEPPPAPTAKGLTGLSGLSGLGATGPTGGSGHDVSGGGSAGGQLEGAAIQRVVANFSPSVRRGCWQPALESRTADAPTGARVGVTITVSPAGNVDNVSTTGDPKGYPNLARCIEGKVRGWKFPQSSGTTTVQVPFVFAAQ